MTGLHQIAVVCHLLTVSLSGHIPMFRRRPLAGIAAMPSVMYNYDGLPSNRWQQRILLGVTGKARRR